MEKKRVFIGFDLDGVILDHAPVKIKLAKNFGFDIKKHQTPSEIINKIITPRSTYLEFKHALYENPETALSPKLLPGIVAFLSRIKKAKIPFALISRRKSIDIPTQLLKKHKLWPQYFNKDNVYFVEKPEDKDVRAIKLGVTHYIDDEPKVLSKLVSVKNKYLFDPLDSYKDSPFLRVKSWREMHKYIF